MDIFEFVLSLFLGLNPLGHHDHFHPLPHFGQPSGDPGKRGHR